MPGWSTGSSAGPLQIQRRADRVVATLTRPEARNAIDQDMIDRLHELCEELEREPRTLILTGSDGVFASGADIAQLRERRGADARRGINTRAFQRVRRLPMPVIAAIDGYALGGGAELAYAADIRIGTPALQIGNPETGLGIIAAAGATWRLPEIVGEARAAEMLLTGRILDADTAVAWGLVSSLYEPDRPARGRTRDRRPHRARTIRSRLVTRRPHCWRRAPRIPRSSSNCRRSSSRALRRSGAWPRSSRVASDECGRRPHLPRME